MTGPARQPRPDFVNACHRYETVAVEAVFDVAARGDLGHSDAPYASYGVTQYGA